MIKSIPEIADEVEPARTILLRDKKVEIDRIPNVTEQDDRVAADKKAGKAPLGGEVENRSCVRFQSQMRRIRVTPSGIALSSTDT